MLAIQGGSSLDKAVKEFARPEVSRDAVAGPNHERVLLLREVAGATLALKQNTAEGRNKLRGFLTGSGCRPAISTAADRYVGTAAFLRNCCSVRNYRQAIPWRQSLKHLDRLLSIFRGRSEMLPYLRRYYDLAIRAAGRGDPVQVAEYLLQSRWRSVRDRVGTSAPLLFHVAQSEKESFALLLAAGHGGGSRHVLPLGDLPQTSERSGFEPQTTRIGPGGGRACRGRAPCGTRRGDLLVRRSGAGRAVTKAFPTPIGPSGI